MADTEVRTPSLLAMLYFTIHHSLLPGRGNRASCRRSGEWHLLHGIEVDDRLLQVEDGFQFVARRLRQVALGLEYLEVGGGAGGELALFGVEPGLGQLASGARRADALLVRHHLSGRLAHLRGDLQLLILQLRQVLVVLEPRLSE